MSEKRFECVFVEDGFGGTYRRLRDNETGIVHMTCDVADLLNFQNTQIKCLKEENEQLKQEHKIAIDEMLTDYKKLEEENEQLRKKLEQIYSFKGLNCRCVNEV